MATHRLNTWRLEIPAIPPTLNHCTKRVGNRYFDTKEYVNFKELVALEIAKKPIFWRSEANLTVSIQFLSPYVFKKKTATFSRRFGDIDNRIKPFLDAVFKPLGRDDVFIESLRVSKILNKEEKTVIVVEW